MAFWWFITFIVLLFIELITINLVSIWFAVGALISMIVSFVSDSLIIQVITFVVVSIFTLLITKPLIKRFKITKIVPTNSDRVIGKRGEVVKKIEANKYGEVKIFGNIWTAYSDQELEIGEIVKVLSIDGVKLIVEKEEK